MNPEEAGRITFRYPWYWIPYTWFLVTVPLSLVLGVYAVTPAGGGGIGGWLILFSCPVVFVLIGIAIGLGTADIEVDDVGISRVLLSVKWQRVRWEDVSKLVITDSISPANGRSVKTYLFLSKKGASKPSSRRIAFQSLNHGMEDLLNKINQCVGENRIDVKDNSVVGS